MSCPDPLQEYIPDEILDDRMSRREQLEQEIARLREELDELGAETQQDLIAEVKPYWFPLS